MQHTIGSRHFGEHANMPTTYLVWVIRMRNYPDESLRATKLNSGEPGAIILKEQKKNSAKFTR